MRRWIVAAAAAALGTAAAAGDAPALKVVDPAEFRQEMEGLARELGLPGAMFLLSTPQGEVVFGYGVTELGKAGAPRADTHFRVASNTKTMTAAVIVQMAEEGRLGLDEPVSAYVEGVPDGERITLRMLLTMRSGLFNFTDAPELAESLDADPDRVWTAAEVLGMAFARPPEFAPGAAYAYNNTNYYLLGLVAEKVDGKPLAAVFRDRLFGPLGMAGTALPAPDSVALPEPLAHGYIYGGASYALVDAPYPADLVAAAKAGALAPEDETWQNPSAYFSAGGVVSTADDLATWMEALVGGRVLDAEFQKQWLESPEAPVPGEPAMQKYGFGILTFSWGPNTIYYHEGEMPGYQSFMGRDPANDVTLVIWSNLTLDLDGLPTANTLMVRALGEIYALSPLDAAR